MSPQAWFTLAVVIVVIALLATTRRHPDLILLGALVALVLVPVPLSGGGWQAGVLSAREALAGFANEGVATIAVLFVVAAGLRDTGAFTGMANRLLGRTTDLSRARLRIMGPAALLSAFMNNTPLVAMLLPVIVDWSRRMRISPSQLLLPLSISSILGGACTLVGTSSNLIVHGWLIARFGDSAALSMFEIAWLGVPIAVLGTALVLVTAGRLLPAAAAIDSEFSDPRHYSVEMLVENDSPLVGCSVAEAGLRHLPGLFLAEIDRGPLVIPAVRPQERLRAADRLIFVGIVESVADLRKFRGLRPATDSVFALEDGPHQRCLAEAVVSDTSPLIGHTIREGQFRSRYNAVVIAVARSRQRIRRKIGDIRLRPGDTLLLEAAPYFARNQRNNRDFYLVSQVEDSTPPRHERSPHALGVLAAMVLLVASGLLGMLQSAVIAAAAMVLAGCCTVESARRAIDVPVLIAIAAALGIGTAIDASGLAERAAHMLFAVVGDNPRAALAAVLFATIVLANLITAKAGAVLMLPIAVSAAASLGLDYRPFAIAVMIAAATAVATPISYPTNLMVYGPGGYRFADYLRIGLPLVVLAGLIALVLIPLLWPFAPR